MLFGIREVVQFFSPCQAFEKLSSGQREKTVESTKLVSFQVENEVDT